MRRRQVVLILVLVGLSLPSTASAATRSGTQRGPIGTKSPLVAVRASAAPTFNLWVGLLEAQAEDQNAAPDYSITNSGLTRVKAGSTVVFAQYFQIYKGPANVTISFIDNIVFNGASVSSKTSTGALANNASKDWRHYYGPLTLNKAGIYTYWCTLTIGGTRFTDRGTITVE